MEPVCDGIITDVNYLLAGGYSGYSGYGGYGGYGI